MAPRPAGHTRGSKLEEATRLFGDQGCTGTTMRDIASAVGVLPGSLYTHIDGREPLLMEIVEAGTDSFLALSQEAMSDGPDTGVEIGERLADALLRGLLGK